MSESDRVLLPQAVLPSHYSLVLTPDLTALVFTCDEDITVTVSESVDEVSLHAKEINITEVSIVNKETSVSQKMSGISYDFKLNTVTIKFPEKLAIGASVLSIKYRGILNGDMAGFYKSTYADADGNKKIMASTQFEALDARRAFPCWDEPAVKATFSVTFIVDAHLTVLSNMPEITCLRLPCNKKRVEFDISPKMSTYLLAWAVGEFDMVQAVTKNNVTIRIFSPPGRAEQGRFALDCGVRSLDFYDDFFKVPYPLPKLDMICITEFAMGAMENWGLVTYRETALMIDETKASSQAKQRVAIVVAHELAHQWFGNLVTMSWWDGLWLNEGFAAWMEHFCIDALYPDYKIWEQYSTDGFSAAQRLDSLRTSHPIIVPIKHAEEVEQVFDAISYCKGSTVVNMVAAIIGKEKFQEGLQVYMKRHAYGNTETNDLWGAWSEVSGVNISELMHSWTTNMGYPAVTVESEKWSANSVEITLRQKWFLADGSVTDQDDGAAPVWSIPLLFASSTEVSDKAVIMNKKVQSFTIPLSGKADDWIKINAGQKALIRVSHTEEMTKRLRPAIQSKTVGPVDRAALLLDAYALAKAGLAPIENVVDLLRAFTDEDSSIVWTAISGITNALYLLLEEIGGSVFESYVAIAKKMVITALDKIGWDAKPTDGHTEKLMRATVIGLLDTFAWNDVAVVKEARRRFDLHWEDSSILPGEYKTTVYKIVLMNGGMDEYEKILKTFYATEDNAERKYAVGSLGAAKQIDLKKRTLDWAVKSGDVKLQDFFYPIGSVSGSSAGCAMAWNYYKENFFLIKEMLSKASPSLMDATIVNSINRFCTLDRADDIEAFFIANPLPSSARRISQSIEQIKSNDALLKIIKKSKLNTTIFW